MENNHLVKRIRDNKDRRVVRIHLLSEGERVIEEVIDKRRDYLNAVLSDFDEEEVTKFSYLLTKLHEEMKKD